jgi:hypothetical protein
MFGATGICFARGEAAIIRSVSMVRHPKSPPTTSRTTAGGIA